MKKIIGFVIAICLFSSTAFAAVEIERVVVGGVCRAWKYYNSAGDLTKIEIFHDAAVGDYYADATVTGSLAWAAGLLGAGDVLLINPGTYQVDRKTTFSAGVTIWAYGAKIQRVDQISTTTETAITQNVTTQISVASAAGLRVGQSINILNDTTYDQQNRTISAIDGTTVTVSTAFGVSASGSTAVHLSFDVLEIWNGGKIYGLEIDGNRANYTFYRWEATTEIHAMGYHNHVIDCYLHDAPGEVIQENAGNAPWNYLPVNGWNVYKNNKIINANGNGVHLSASISPLIESNYFESCNLENTAMGHGGGAVAFSSQIKDARIIGNTMISCRSAVGYGNSFSASNTIIRGNVIRSMSAYAVEFETGTQNSPFINLLIDGNKITDSVSVYLAATWAASDPANPTGTTTSGSPIITSVSSMANIQNGMTISGTGIPADSIIVGNDGVNQIIIGNRSGSTVNATADGSGTTLSIAGENPYNIQITNNAFINTKVALYRLKKVVISGNAFEWYPSDTTNASIHFANFVHQCAVSGNTFRYGLSGVVADVGLVDTTISANAFILQNYYGVNAGEANTNLLVADNIITNDATANAGSYQGIRVGGGSRVKNNSINLTTGYATVRIVADSVGVIVQGNTTSNAAYNGSARFDIRGETGLSACLVINNQSNDALSDASSACTARDNDAF